MALTTNLHPGVASPIKTERTTLHTTGLCTLIVTLRPGGSGLEVKKAGQLFLYYQTNMRSRYAGRYNYELERNVVKRFLFFLKYFLCICKDTQKCKDEQKGSRKSTGN